MLLLILLPMSIMYTSSKADAAIRGARPLDASGSYSLLLPLLLHRAPSPPIVYLPLINRFTPAVPTMFGGEIRGSYVNNLVADRAHDANLSFVRFHAISWADVERVQGQRDWSYLEDEFEKIEILSNNGLVPMVIVRDTPKWAQADPNPNTPDVRCGPMRPDTLDDFASFMGELVTRLRRPPYNVQYYEMGNEVDVSFAEVANNSNTAFGCWGDPNDPNYGGYYYGEMLKAVYPAIKAANPRAMVVTGGLLLGCDPAEPPPNQTCIQSRFLRGILDNPGAINSFDILAYHAYPFWGTPDTDWDLRDSRWDQRGGMLLGKLNYLREILAEYGVGKAIMMNEGSLLCYDLIPNTCSSAMYDGQATHAVRMYARSMANGLIASLWYGVDGPGWRDGGLLDSNQNPRPAYYTIQFLAEKLTGATWVATPAPPTLNGLESYIFANNGRYYTIYWTNNRVPVTVNIPAGSTVYNKLGQPIGVGATYDVLWEPIIIESN